MKRLNISGFRMLKPGKIFVFLFLLVFSVHAQTVSSKAALETLIKKAQSSKDSAYALVAWNTKKNDKKFTPVDISKPAQFRIAKRLIKRISNYIKISDSFKILAPQKTDTTEVVPVEFISKKRNIRVKFELVKIGNYFYLVDIN